MSQAWPSVSLYPCNQQELSRNCTRTQRPRKIRSVANLKAQTNSKPTWDQQNNSIIHTPCHQSELPSNIASLQGRSSRTISPSSFLDYWNSCGLHSYHLYHPVPHSCPQEPWQLGPGSPKAPIPFRCQSWPFSACACRVWPFPKRVSTREVRPCGSMLGAAMLIISWLTYVDIQTWEK